MQRTVDANVSVHSVIVDSDSHRSTTPNENQQNDKGVASNPEASSSRDEGCDPSYYRNNSQCLSDPNVWTVLIKSVIGTGIFAMPYAFSCVGLILGIVLLIFMGFLITKCLRLLLRIHEETCKRLDKSGAMYDEIVEDTLKNFDRKTPPIVMEMATYLTNAMLIFYYLVVSSVCIDFIGEIMRDIMKFEETGRPARYTFIFLPCFMVINLSKDLRDMVLKSLAGNILILNVVIIGLIFSFGTDTSNNWTLLNNDILMYPKFIGIVLYSLSSPGLILAIEHVAKNPWHYGKRCTVLDQGMTLIVCLHLVVGIIGYLKLGSNVSDNFIRDIQRGAEGYALLAFIMQGLAIYLTYGLQCHVPIGIILKRYVAPAVEYGICKGTFYLWEQITRFFVTLVSCILPVFIPTLRKQIAVLSLTCNFNLTLILPLILHVLLLMKDVGEAARSNPKVIIGIFSIFFAGALGFSFLTVDLIQILKSTPVISV